MNSIWLDNMEFKNTKKLEHDLDVDVLIIGGGLTGLSIAYNLINTKLKVALVEKNTIGYGVTSRTTGKLTYLQELIYTSLSKTYNEDVAKLYLESQKDAIKTVTDIIENEKIDCNLESDKSFVFTDDESKVEKINKEYELLKSFNVNVKKTNTLPDGRKVKQAIYVDDTMTFHPIKYLLKLKEIVINNNIDVYENTKIIKIDDGFICYTQRNAIHAKKVVIAMHYPYFLLPMLLPLKTHLEKSYIAAYKVKENLHFSAINIDNPSLSMRFLNNYKIVLNYSHNLAFNNNDAKNFDNLIRKLPTKPDYIWSNKDIITSDKLPFIGLIKENLYMATGFNTWGMTNGILSGSIIRDMILGQKSKYHNIFDPKRGFNINKLVSYPINIFSSAKSFIDTKVNKNKSWYSSKVKFEKRNGKNVGIYTDENKKEHIVYNICPHLKCSLIFNETELTWDCPCHGSRFSIDGKCIEGPSNFDITYKG